MKIKVLYRIYQGQLATEHDCDKYEVSSDGDLIIKKTFDLIYQGGSLSSMRAGDFFQRDREIARYHRKRWISFEIDYPPEVQASESTADEERYQAAMGRIS